MRPSDSTPAYEADALIAQDIDAYLVRHQHKSCLLYTSPSPRD